MFNKTSYLVLISVFILIFGLTCVSAAQDNITTDEIALDENIGIKLSVENEANLEDSGNGTFAELNNIIRNAEENTEIKLEKDYFYGNKSGSINLGSIKSLNIDGQGHTIDGNSYASIFYTYDKINLTIKNINFVNTGTVIRTPSYEDYNSIINIYNCNFTNVNGYAIATGKGSLSISNCNFDNIQLNSDGGALYGSAIRIWGYCNSTISNCNFTNCSVYSRGGGISGGIFYIGEYSNSNISNCIFTNCSAYSSGGGVEGGTLYISGRSNSNMSNCIFINCSTYSSGAGVDGDAVFIVGGFTSDGHNNQFNVNFSSNTTYTSVNIVNCTFIGKASSIENDNTNTNTNNNQNSNTNNNQNSNKPSKKKTLKATKISAKNKAFRAKKKTKLYSITLKSGKKAVKKVKLTLKIGKKMFKASTNNKGKATFKITKLNKKGTYKSKILFKGNKYYKANSKTVKIIVK